MSSQFRDIRNSRRIKKLFKLPEEQRGLTEKDINDLIDYAIQKNYKIDMFYEDDYAGGTVLRGYRSIAPVALGVHRSTGNVVFRGYLLEGISKSERIPKWRLWRVDRVRSIKLFTLKQKARWNTKYRPNDKHMSQIFRQAEIPLERKKQLLKTKITR